MVYTFMNKYGYGGRLIHVHPFKQKAVKHMIDNIFDWVDYAILFGSSVHPACHPASDIDVCLIGKSVGEFNSQKLRVPGQAYDFICCDTLPDLKAAADESINNIYRTILEKGVIVYDKHNNFASASNI